MRTAFPIRNDDDLTRAIELIDVLWDSAPDSDERILLEVMSALVDAYEAARSDLPPADPIELINFKLREHGWSQRELGRRLGWSNGRVSEVLSRKRPLTLAMVRALSAVLEIPAGLLVHDQRESADGDLWVAVPAAIARNIGKIARQRGVSIQVAATDTLTWALSSSRALGLTNVGSQNAADVFPFAANSMGPFNDLFVAKKSAA